MPPRELIEVAGLVAFHSRSLFTSMARLNDEAVGAYWLASRCRIDRWGYALRAYSQAAGSPSGNPSVRLVSLAEEIVVSEVLTRTVAALFHAHDQLHGRRESAPLGRNILAGHREAVDRLHAVTAAWWSHEAACRRALESLELRCERWTDLLLGYLHEKCDVKEFAFDSQRVNDFAADHAGSRPQSQSYLCGNLLIASLRAAFADVGSASPNDDLHAQVAGATLGCFGSETFDSFGLLRSTWLDRMQRTMEETDALIGELFAKN
jgi:hypothetical protein